MAELLVKAKHTLYGDVEKQKGIWRRGDVIDVRPDGFEWGRQEYKANWIASGETPESWHGQTFLVKIPGVAVAKVETILEGEDDESGKILRRRKKYLAVDATPQQIKDKVGNDYEITVTPLQIKNFLRDKDTDNELNLEL